MDVPRPGVRCLEQPAHLPLISCPATGKGRHTSPASGVTSSPRPFSHPSSLVRVCVLEAQCSLHSAVRRAVRGSPLKAPSRSAPPEPSLFGAVALIYSSWSGRESMSYGRALLSDKAGKAQLEMCRGSRKAASHKAHVPICGMDTALFLLQKDTSGAGLRVSHGADPGPPCESCHRAKEALLGVHQQRQGTLCSACSGRDSVFWVVVGPKDSIRDAWFPSQVQVPPSGSTVILTTATDK